MLTQTCHTSSMLKSGVYLFSDLQNTPFSRLFSALSYHICALSFPPKKAIINQTFRLSQIKHNFWTSRYSMLTAMRKRHVIFTFLFILIHVLQHYSDRCPTHLCWLGWTCSWATCVTFCCSSVSTGVSGGFSAAFANAQCMYVHIKLLQASNKWIPNWDLNS